MAWLLCLMLIAQDAAPKADTGAAPVAKSAQPAPAAAKAEAGTVAPAAGDAKQADAQPAAAKAGEPAAKGPRAPAPTLFDYLPPFILMLVALYFIMIYPEQNRAKTRQKLMDSLKKNDRVVTVGGIVGIVANVKPESDEILLKIDEDKDIKVRFTKASIAHVLSTKEAGETAAEKK